MTLFAFFSDDFIDQNRDVIFSQFGNLGNLVTVVVEQCDVQQFLQTLQTVGANVGVCSFWAEQVVSLFPNPNGMRLDSRKVLHIPNAEGSFYVVHHFHLNVKQIYD